MFTNVASLAYQKLKRSVACCILVTLGLVGLSTDSFAQAISYSLENVGPASSGTAGHIDAKLKIQVINNTGLPQFRFNINDDYATDFGSTFIRVVPFSNQIEYVSPGSAALVADPSYDGMANSKMLVVGGILNVGDTICVGVLVELDPDAAGAPTPLMDTATVVWEFPPGTPQSAGSNAIILPDCWSDCVLACNNLVHVSVNSMCNAEVYSEMVLEGEDAICAQLGFYTVDIYDGNTKLSMPISQSYVGSRLRAVITNIVCGNSCWGYIEIEDKNPPVLTCKSDTFTCGIDFRPINTGFPVNPALVNTMTYPYVALGLDACGPVYLEYRDSIVRRDCTDPDFSSIIYRKWTATDYAGYMTMCWDTLYFRRGTLADIVLPCHYDGQPGVGHCPELQCDDAWTRFPNGFPDTTVTGTGPPSWYFVR